MIENLPWEEYAANPDKYVKMLEEQEEESQRDLYKVRQELRLVRQIKKQKDTAEEWRAHGVPDQRRPDDPYSTEDGEPSDEASRANGHPHGPTRKERVLALMGQDSSRIWKVANIAIALDDHKIKSIRVAMDELVRAGSLTKHPGANYQFNTASPRSS
ncbi:hypothetical protein ABT124_15595 [Streptomyces sp. NPDC001982]|uniref:hypothetical protein n=1 Tax=Streptomyces sp. NPDC001982 TaxID=3154405 RepID=UPI003322FF7A